MRTNKVARSNVVTFLVFALLGVSPLSGCDKNDLDGWTCEADTECLSGYCTDGVCCEERCAQTCMACSADKKGSGWDGSCEPIAAGTDPDGECHEELTCSGNSACTFLSTGTPCSSAQQCLSGQCVDGVCCSTKCSDTCMACSAAKKGHGVDGICETIALNTDPDEECLLDCNGVGACIPLSPGQPCQVFTDCESRMCEDGVCCAQECHYPCFACTAAKKGWGKDGDCGAIAENLDPDDDCINACNGFGECIYLPNGTACSFYAECITSNCADGVCCDTFCREPCRSCTAAKKGAGSDGTCGYTAAGTDPDDRCPGAVVCNEMGSCDYFVNGAMCARNDECASGFCVEGVCCKTPCLAGCMICNGPGAMGTCTETQPNACGPICSDPVVFSTETTLDVNDYTDLVALADMNGDGKKDLLLRIPFKAYDLEIHLRTGDKTFAPPTGYMTKASDLVTADFNGDGKPDVALASESKNTMSVYLNTGDGTLGPGIDHIVAGKPIGIVSTDMNGDGRIDIAVASNETDSVSVFLNQGNATFSPKIDYLVTDRPVFITAADINGDNKPELATLSFNKTIQVLMNNGNGTFGTRVDYVDKSARNFTFADVTSDGKPDLVIGAINHLAVFRNMGNGMFAPPTEFPATLDDIVAADFNGDGKIDVAGTSWNLYAAGILLNQGNGTFGPQVDYGVDGVPFDIAAGDTTDDGLLDLAIAANTSGKVSLLENKGNGKFIARDTNHVHSSVSAMLTADLNGDTWEDIVAFNSGATGVMVFLNDTSGAFNRSGDYFMFGGSTAPVAADVDGDGDLDIAVGNRASWGDLLSSYLNNGDGTFAMQIDNELTSAARDMVAIEATGDGNIDMAIVTAGFQQQSLQILKNLGNGQFLKMSAYDLPGDGFSIAATDMNGDGLLDLVAGYYDHPNTMGVLVHMNQGDGTFLATGDYPIHMVPVRLQTADLTEDGRPDLVVSGPGYKKFHVLINVGNGTLAGPLDLETTSFVGSLAFSDMTGDGHLDVVVGDEEGESFGIQARDATGAFASQINYPLVHAYSAVGFNAAALVAPADFNHDGKMDLAVIHPESTQRQVLDVYANNSINACFP